MISSQGKMKELKVSLMKKCKEMEIPLVGIASVERWENAPFQPWMPGGVLSSIDLP